MINYHEENIRRELLFLAGFLENGRFQTLPKLNPKKGRCALCGTLGPKGMHRVVITELCGTGVFPRTISIDPECYDWVCEEAGRIIMKEYVPVEVRA